MNSEDFEGIFKFKFFIPFFYIASWTCMIFGPLFFKEVYQVICMVIVSYSMLKTIGLISGSIYAICKLNSIISSFEEEKERKNIETNEVIQNSKIVHAIVIPNYKQEVELLEQTLKVLGNHKYAKQDYFIFLAMEAHEEGGGEKANKIITNNKEKFKYMGFTLHQVRVDEAKGKASNVSWCVQHMMQQLTDLNIKQDQILLTIMDADSWAPQQYFYAMNKKIAEKPQVMENGIFCAPQIYTRNNLEVPVVNRVYDIMHSFVHLSNLQAVWFSFPLSNYSLSYSLVKKVGFWDTNADAIGEDFHTCQKCFWKNEGDIETIPICTPFNQLSLTTGEGYCRDMKARFWQAERHTRGVSDVAYCLNMLFKTSCHCLNIIMTFLVAEVFLLAAFIPWALLALGLQYKVIQDEDLHVYPMLLIDLLLNMTLVFTTLSYIFYEIFKRKSNTVLFKQENEPLWRVIEYPIFFVIALFGYSIPSFIISSFGVLCTKTEYKVAEKVVTKNQGKIKAEEELKDTKQTKNEAGDEMQRQIKKFEEVKNPEENKIQSSTSKENEDSDNPTERRLRIPSSLQS